MSPGLDNPYLRKIEATSDSHALGSAGDARLRDPGLAHPFPDIEIRHLHIRYQAFRNCKYPAELKK